MEYMGIQIDLEKDKLFDELAPDTSGMGTVAEKPRSILTEPRWASVR